MRVTYFTLPPQLGEKEWASQIGEMIFLGVNLLTPPR